MKPIVVKIGGSALGNHDTTSVPNQRWLDYGKQQSASFIKTEVVS